MHRVCQHATLTLEILLAGFSSSSSATTGALTRKRIATFSPSCLCLGSGAARRIVVAWQAGKGGRPGRALKACYEILNLRNKREETVQGFETGFGQSNGWNPGGPLDSTPGVGQRRA